MISIILCGLLSLISTPVQSQSGDQSPAVAQAVDQVLRPLVDSGKVVGMSVGILSGERSYVFGLGSTQRGEAGTVPTGKTIFEIGSVSKVFTASLLSELVERGEVSLDDPLTRVERFRTSDLLGVALEQIRDAMDQATTLGRVHRGPATVVEGDAGGRDRQLGVLTGRLIDHDDKTAVCRASDLAHESLGSCEPLTVDE